MTLPWKVLVLSLVGLVVLEAYDLDYVAGWLYARLDMSSSVAWDASGVARELALHRVIGGAAFVITNAMAWGFELVAKRLVAPPAEPTPSASPTSVDAADSKAP